MQSKKIKNSATIGDAGNKRNLRKVGGAGEELACNYLISNGYIILDKNFRCPLGEIDIVAKKGREYYFVEVKMRFTRAFGSPFEAIDVKKRKKIIAAAKWYMARAKICESICHLSAAGIDASVSPPHIVFIPDAFDTDL